MDPFVNYCECLPVCVALEKVRAKVSGYIRTHLSRFIIRVDHADRRFRNDIAFVLGLGAIVEGNVNGQISKASKLAAGKDAQNSVEDPGNLRHIICAGAGEITLYVRIDVCNGYGLRIRRKLLETLAGISSEDNREIDCFDRLHRLRSVTHSGATRALALDCGRAELRKAGGEHLFRVLPLSSMDVAVEILKCNPLFFVGG